MKKYLVGFIVAVCGVVFSRYYLDTRVARLADHAMRDYAGISTSSYKIPDVLGVFSFVAAGLSGVVWLFMTYRKSDSAWKRFFLHLAILLPTLLVLTSVLKFVFGGAGPRGWLRHPGMYGFHWMDGGGIYNAFPSGHMVVAAALVSCLWRFLPGYRYAGVALPTVLAAALIVTGYHFVSDLIAGLYIGFLVEAALFGIEDLPAECKCRVVRMEQKR